MHTSPVGFAPIYSPGWTATDVAFKVLAKHLTQAPPKVLTDRDAGLVAAFEMLCERMGKLEEIAEHWLCRPGRQSTDGLAS